MALDLSKLHDAIGKVADLAQDHAALQRAHGDTTVLLAQHKAELEQAQKDVDALVEQLVAAATSPAEQVGITAVAAAILAPAPVAPVAPVTPMLPPVSPIAPVAPVVSVGTFLPGDPRAR